MGHGERVDPERIRLLFRALLKREARPHEVREHAANVPSADALIAMILASDEYAARVAWADETPRYVNIWRPELAEHALPVGTVSPDGVAVAGHEGQLFLGERFDRWFEQARGDDEVLPDGWLEDWLALLAQRRAALEGAGRTVLDLVVPHPAVATGLHPRDAELRGPRPIERLLAAGAPLLYPLDELRGRAMWLQTDTHLTVAGNHAQHRVVADALGIEPVPPPPAETTLVRGNLGRRFDPPVLELAEVHLGFGAATVTHDELGQVRQDFVKVGARLCLRNETAPDPRSVIVFGDSHARPIVHGQGTAWYLAQCFRAVEFVWAPHAWDPALADRAGADVVVFVSSEQLLRRLPLPAVDVAAVRAQVEASADPLGTGLLYRN